MSPPNVTQDKETKFGGGPEKTKTCERKTITHKKKYKIQKTDRQMDYNGHAGRHRRQRKLQTPRTIPPVVPWTVPPVVPRTIPPVFQRTVPPAVPWTVPPAVPWAVQHDLSAASRHVLFFPCSYYSTIRPSVLARLSPPIGAHTDSTSPHAFPCNKTAEAYVTRRSFHRGFQAFVFRAWARSEISTNNKKIKK